MAKCNRTAKLARELNEEIRRALAKRMKDLGWSQTELAKRMGKTRANINIILRQENIISIPTLIEFCDALDLNFDILIRERYRNDS